MRDVKEALEQALLFLQAQTDVKPAVGVVCGTGLASLAEQMEVSQTVAFADIPGFFPTRVVSHPGKLLFGTWGGQAVVVQQGRFHYYEGHSLADTTFPIRVMQALGVHTLVLTNAAGGIAAGLEKGDILLLSDHIHTIPDNPLRGTLGMRLGNPFPDMRAPYNANLRQAAQRIGTHLGLHLKTGIYASVAGPSLETEMEYRALRTLGADAVGMSTTPETIVARQLGMRVLAFSVITDTAFPKTPEATTTLDSILEVAKMAAGQLAPLLTQLLETL